MKHKIDNKTKKQLLFLAGKLPVVLVNTHEKHIMTKDELEEMGYVGAEKMDDGRYVYNSPLQIAMNHYRGLMKAFRKSGAKGCGEYIDKINAI